MKIDQLAAEVRPRLGWEAMDLGGRMVQHWSADIYKAWFLFAIPLWSLIAILCMGHWYWAAFFMWLTKPLLDYPVMFIISRGLFSATPNLKTTRKATLSMWLKDGWRELLTRRISMTRSMVYPVSYLENLRDNSRSKRIQALTIRGQSASHVSWLTVLWFHLESVMVFAFWSLILMLQPRYIEFDFGWSWWSADLVWWVMPTTYALYGLTISVLEPYFVCAGFAAYINRRTELEGWDIELGFRKLAARL